MAYPLDLDAYFERIGYRGSRAPTLATLNLIILGHVQKIPFENLDVLLGRKIDLTPSAIERKLVHGHRGGYCFEQNTLLLYVLSALGYTVQAISARVRFQRPRDPTPPRTHVFLRVEIDGAAWLVDVGVGGLTPTRALRLALDAIQETPHEPRRIVASGGWSTLALRAPGAVLYHQVYFAEAWHDVCEFTLEEMPAIDRELGNWFTSAHPASPFKERLTVARATASGRITLTNRELAVRHPDGHVESRMLSTPEELLDTLAREFELVLPAGTLISCPGLDWPNRSEASHS